MAATTRPAPEVPHTRLMLPVLEREALVLGGPSPHWITGRVCGILENRQPPVWWLLFIPSVLMAAIGLGGGLIYLVVTGVGVLGNTNRVMWGWPIVNFVFWIGIGHAGTLISAILYLSRQRWRTSINRAAEAMTIFAVMCAGIFPAFHVGRVWMAWNMAPVPNANAIWQNFKSPLMWDVFAVSTYFTVSLIFWFLGMVPDLATVRDRCPPGIRKLIYGVLALGWRGGNRQWSHYEMAYLLLAALATPLVLSVHSVVSFDFATSVVPGWHTTIFPPYFVAGAIFGGFAMVLTIMIPARHVYGLHNLITIKHIDNMARIVLLTGTLLGYAYLMELFVAFYSGSIYEMDAFKFRIAGPFGWAYVTMVVCNMLVPQVFWVRACRENPWVVMCVALLVNVGMWFERFVIVVTTLTRSWLPGDWKTYAPTAIDVLLFIGSLGLFLSLFLLFLRFLPCINLSEVKRTQREADPCHAEYLQQSDPGVATQPAYQRELAPGGKQKHPITPHP
jgi:Ni/Fe-hydrogenase subunit HybB-like protein